MRSLGDKYKLLKFPMPGSPIQGVLVLMVFAAISFVPAMGQSAAGTAVQNPAPAAQRPDNSQGTTAKMSPQELADQQRKDQLAADTAKLLQLANELKAEMDKSTKDTLSLSVVKKAEQVEKLAHKVRDEMKASIGN
ncbi:hypothetical protein [Acidicapsa acidisoli]|uniref:hypothetical protein n=1 Tax=Acidicapsa acidisoli TaxID=1615681 RepID=UPI0021DF7182|nr:hypothetical protein [Acidicapsa acidisoli]